MFKISIILLMFSAVVLLFYSTPKLFKSLAKDYQERFTESAHVNLTDLFLFIEPQKLFRFNLVGIFVGSVFTWIYLDSWVLALLVGLFLFAIPNTVYKILKKRRRKAFVFQLPDTLMEVASSMRAGSSLISALEIMVRESPTPTDQEFGLVLRELRIGGEFGKTLDKMALRANDPEVELIVAGMKISKEVGGNLADMLERMAETLRKKLEMEGKIEALTSQGKAQGIVMSLLPALIVLALNYMEPEAMEHLWNDPVGWAVIAIALTLQFIGYKFIKKIVTIDV